MFITTEGGSPLLTESTLLQLLLEGPTPPLQTVLPSYLYTQYADDANLQAFVTSYNTITQEYLNWFNQTPLSVYTNPNVSGPLLDWIGQGIYGIERPVFSTFVSRRYAGLNSSPLNSVALNGFRQVSSGSASNATDDYYRRVLTWWLYAGDGRNFNVEVLRLKVARFIYGANGTDVTLSQAQSIRIEPQNVPSPASPVLQSVAGGSIVARKYGAWITYTNSIGETLSGSPSSLSVGANSLLIVKSPPKQNGATGWYPYVNVLASGSGRFIAGINSRTLNTRALDGNGTNPVTAPTRQATTPIAIGTDWEEPTSGLVVGAALPTQNTSNTVGNFIITVPPGTASQTFQQAFAQGLLAFPFQFTGTVVIST